MNENEEGKYLLQVFRTLNSNPTAADIDFLVEAYARVGYLAADAEGLAEQAEAERKHAEATAYLDAKRLGDKVTDRRADAIAMQATKEYRDGEVEARTKARKLKNLLNSIEQAINAVKYLGRQAG